VQAWDWAGRAAPLTVRVYTKLPCVFLLLNGQNVSRGCTPAGAFHSYTASFTVPFTPGTLTAVGYSLDSRFSAQASVATTGPPVSLRLVPDRVSIGASRDDLCFVTVEVVDADGRLTTCDHVAQPSPHLNPGLDLSQTANSSPRALWPGVGLPLSCVPPTVFFSVSGPGSLEAVGSAYPADVSSFSATHRRTYRGRALAILRPGALGVSPGEGVVRLTAEADGLASASIAIRVVA
jgi:beta-galactosidase